MKHKHSETIWQISQKIIPGGVNSPVRAFNSVQGEPVAIKRGRGCFIEDEDANIYLDFVNSWGPLLLGHANVKVVKAQKKQASYGTSFGAVTLKEYKLAKLITGNIRHVEMIRFVSSGTEAVMSAIRLARGYTKKKKIVKFSGCYHGHSDSMLVKAGSGMLTFTENIERASSPGVTEGAVQDTLVLKLDDASVNRVFDEFGTDIAAVIIEPLPANSGLLVQRLEFLRLLQEKCKASGSLLIFDEVISGFRLGFSGFAGLHDFSPDLVTYGKIIGGGLPVGAFAGRREIMQHLSPTGEVYQAGTLSGNPMAMASGLATLKYIIKNDVYQKLDDLAIYLGKKFEEKIEPLNQALDFNIQLVQKNSIFWFAYFPGTDHVQEIRSVEDIWDGAAEIYAGLHRKMLEQGIYLAPSAYEVGFLSSPMTEKEIDRFIKVLAKSLKATDSERKNKRREK